VIIENMQEKMTKSRQSFLKWETTICLCFCCPTYEGNVHQGNL